MDRFYGMLGLCAKAGKLVSGNFSVEKSIKSGQVYTLIVAADASEATKSSYAKLCAGYEVELHIYGTMDELSTAIGKSGRAAVAITDEGFAKTLVSKMTRI